MKKRIRRSDRDSCFRVGPGGGGGGKIRHHWKRTHVLLERSVLPKRHLTLGNATLDRSDYDREGEVDAYWLGLQTAEKVGEKLVAKLAIKPALRQRGGKLDLPEKRNPDRYTGQSPLKKNSTPESDSARIEGKKGRRWRIEKKKYIRMGRLPTEGISRNRVATQGAAWFRKMGARGKKRKNHVLQPRGRECPQKRRHGFKNGKIRMHAGLMGNRERPPRPVERKGSRKPGGRKSRLAELGNNSIAMRAEGQRKECLFDAGTEVISSELQR